MSVIGHFGRSRIENAARLNRYARLVGTWAALPRCWDTLPRRRKASQRPSFFKPTHNIRLDHATQRCVRTLMGQPETRGLTRLAMAM